MAPVEPNYSWGAVTIVDRLGESNRFASFGGLLTVSRDGDVHAALFRSDAPILLIGGHSGSPDTLAVQAAGFFAVLRAAAGDPEIARLIDGSSPNALYAAFVARTLATFRSLTTVGMGGPHMSSVLRSEQSRLEREHGSDARRGIDLACLL